MGPARTAICGGTHQTSPAPSVTHNGQRAALRAAHRLRLAPAARRLATLAECVLLTLAECVLLPAHMAPGWHPGAYSHRAARPAAVALGRDPQPSAGSVDSQSVQTTSV